MPKLDQETLQLIIAASAVLALLAVVLQTCILLAILVSVRKTAKSLHKEAQELRSSVMPIIYNTRDLFTRIAPNIESATMDLAVLSRGLRDKTEEVEFAVAEILERLNHHLSRLDAMFVGALDQLDHAGVYVAETVGKPLRQLSGLLAAVKAVAGSLRNSA